MGTFEYIDILNWFLISWVVSSMAESISDILPDNKLGVIGSFILGCRKCTSFWLTLGCTLNIYLAALIAFCMFIYGKIENEIGTKIK